jgi:hypothetical protein
MKRSDELWEDSIIPSLSKFVEIAALSPSFEPNWEEKGDLDATIKLFCSWLDEQNLTGMSYEIHRMEGLTPVLLDRKSVV